MVKLIPPHKTTETLKRLVENIPHLKDKKTIG